MPYGIQINVRMRVWHSAGYEVRVDFTAFQLSVKSRFVTIYFNVVGCYIKVS